MNIYKIRFERECPVDGAVIDYTLHIATTETIMAEMLKAACCLPGRAFHEDMANRLHKEFGGKQIMVAKHGVVDITTFRGF